MRRALHPISGVLVVILVAVGGAAYAGTWQHEDGTGDVYTTSRTGVVFHSERSGDTDLRSVSFRHAPRAVYVRAEWVNLARNDDTVVLYVNIRTSANHEVHSIVASISPRDRDGSSGYSCGPGEVCPGLRARFDYAANTVVLRIPRACLDNPRWVRLQAYGLTYRPRIKREYFDPAFSTGSYRDDWSPRIYRG